MEYKEQVSSQIPPAPVPVSEYNFATKYEDDYISAGRDYWIKNNNQNAMNYNKGVISGKYGKNALTLYDFFNRISISIKENVANELSNNQKTVDELKQNFELLDLCLKILAKDLSTPIEAKKENFNVKNVVAFLHGFINGYVESVTSEPKIKRVNTDEK